MNPSESFSAGETVRINFSHDIQATDLTFLRSEGYAYQFQVACMSSSGNFQEIDTFSNRISNVQTRIYGAAASERSPQDLQRDVPVQLRITRAIHLAHAPGTQGSQNLVLAQRFPIVLIDSRAPASWSRV